MAFGKIHAPQAAQPTHAVGLRVQTSVYGAPIALCYGQQRIPGNLIWYGDFVAVPVKSGGGGGGGGKGGGGSSATVTSYTYYTAVAIGLCEGVITGILKIWNGKALVTLTGLGLTVFTGAQPQTPWGYLTTKHPGQDLGYEGLAYVAGSSILLGSGPDLPNFNFEVQGLQQNVPSKVDASPKDVVVDFLTHAEHGVGFPASRLGDLTTFANYVKAANLLVSPYYSTQSPAMQLMKDLLDAVNCAPVWSGGLLLIVPYGDTALSGNGATYTPPSAPLYDLADDDFLPSPDASGPVGGMHTRPADAFNVVRFEFLDRAHDYNQAIAEAKDQNAIEVFGLRPDSPRPVHFFCDAAIAQQAAQLALQRQLVRNQYTFTLGWKYALLDPMDLVTITDAAMGLDHQWVRIVDITEDEAGALTVLAEEYLGGSGAAALYSFQSTSGFSADYNVAPGNVNGPILFEPPYEIAEQGYEVWAAISGGVNWGSAEVWVSEDGVTYGKVGIVTNPARMGTLTQMLPADGVLDQTNTLKVDLTPSRAQLLSGTQADAEQYVTLCYVDGELMAYKTATLTAAYKYDLTYLTRGAYRTVNAQHFSGTNFARLDGAIFKYPFAISRIGQTLHFKFVSLNQYGGGRQDIAAVTDYSYVVQGSAKPPAPTGFYVTQNGTAVVAIWDRIGLYDQSGFELRYGPSGGSWETAINISRATRGTHVTTGIVPPGTWIFYLKARDQQGVYSDQAAVTTATPITYSNEANFTVPQELDWTGVLTNMVRHWTGVLTPDSQGVASSDDWNTFDTFVYNPYATCTYESPEIDVAFDDPVRFLTSLIFAQVPGPGVGVTGVPVYKVKWKTGAGSYNAYQTPPVGQITLRYMKGELVIDTTVCIPVLTAFDPSFNAVPYTQTAVGQSIAVGGTPFTFTTAFHMIPSILVTPSGAVTPVLSSVTPFGFVLSLFDGATDVGGVARWDATGI